MSVYLGAFVDNLTDAVNRLLICRENRNRILKSIHQSGEKMEKDDNSKQHFQIGRKIISFLKRKSKSHIHFHLDFLSWAMLKIMMQISQGPITVFVPIV